MNMIRVAYLPVLLLALAPVAAEAQSFNCYRARTADETLICQDRVLSRLDEQMASMYDRARNRLYGRAQQTLIRDQSAWLKSRYSCGRDADCIERVYRARIAQLSTY